MARNKLRVHLADRYCGCLSRVGPVCTLDVGDCRRDHRVHRLDGSVLSGLEHRGSFKPGVSGHDGGVADMLVELDYRISAANSFTLSVVLAPILNPTNGVDRLGSTLNLASTVVRDFTSPLVS